MIEAHSAELKAWRTAVAWSARVVWRGEPLPLEQAVRVELVFEFARPARSSRSYPCTGGGLDADKLARACLDALKGLVWCDDSQVVELVARKGWGRPGVSVVVTAIALPI